MSPTKNINKQTWVTPDGDTYNQIDHTLVPCRDSSSAMGVESCRGADSNSDHIRAHIKFKYRMSKIKASLALVKLTYNVKKLKNVEWSKGSVQ